MRIEIKAYGNDPVYESFSENSRELPSSRLLLPICLEQGVKLTFDGKYQTMQDELNMAYLVVQPTKEQAECFTSIYAFQEDESLIGQPQDRRVTNDIYAHITVKLPVNEYQRIFETKPNLIKLEIELDVDGDEIRIIKDSYVLNPSSKLNYLQVQVGGSNTIPKQIFGELKDQYHKKIRNNLKARYGQLALACEQFSESIASGINKISVQMPADIKDCVNILDIARSAFTIEEIHFSEDESKLIWRHQDISGMIQYGDEKNREQLAGFNPNIGKLEKLASMLLNLKTAKSKVLENCVLDALVFAETIAYARIFYSKKKMLGMRLAEPLKGVEDDSLFVGISKILGQGVAFYAKEIIFIAITYGVAFMLSAGDVTAAWVITSLFTVFRWYSKQEANKEDPKYKGAVLLNKMIAFYETVNLNHEQPNLELTKRKLLDLEKDGAVYSRFVYEIIERKLLDHKSNL
jgi:hypothetical protein